MLSCVDPDREADRRAPPFASRNRPCPETAFGMPSGHTTAPVAFGAYAVVIAPSGAPPRAPAGAGTESRDDGCGAEAETSAHVALGTEAPNRFTGAG